MIRFKPEVRIKQFQFALVSVLVNVSMWSNRTDKDVHISSIDDSEHGANTLHGLGLAVDVNPDSLSAADREDLYQYLRRTMPDHYDVIAEVDHIHIEWDIKRPESRIGKT